MADITFIENDDLHHYDIRVLFAKSSIKSNKAYVGWGWQIIFILVLL